MVELVSRDATLESTTKISEESGRINKLNRLRKLISKRKGRTDSFSRIVEPLDNNRLSYVAWLYGPLALAISITGCSLATLLPIYNVLVFPDYWYEVLFQIVAFGFFAASFLAVRGKAILKSFDKSTFSIIFCLGIFNFHFFSINIK